MTIIDAVYPDAIVSEYHDGNDWVDISAYVVSDIQGNSGMASSKQDDRVATLGTKTFDLNNVDKLFTPYGGDSARGLSTLTGFNKGAKIRTSVVIGGIPKVFWVGKIADIRSDDGLWGDRRVHLVCVDWMDVATRFPMKGSAIQTNKRINEVVTTILSRLSVQPEDTRFDVGNELIPAALSNVKDKSKAISELNKLALTELGAIYLLSDGTLRVENSTARKGTRALDSVPSHPNTLDTLGLLSGDTFSLLSGDQLLLAEVGEANLEFSAEKENIELTDDVINAVYARAYPTRVDTSLKNVFVLGSPLYIAGGQTITFTGYYRDPNGGNFAINATNQQTPTATTDYLCNTEEDGSGTNLTASLTVSATYYGDLVDYEITNTSSSGGWITKLNARGYGIYFDSPVDDYFENPDSIGEHGDTVLELDQKYKKDFYSGIMFGKSIIEQYKIPKSRVKSARFLANLNPDQLMACTYLDVGSLVKIYENRSEMTKYYYIYSRKFLITLGKIITVTFGLIEIACIASGGLNPVAVEFGGEGTTDAINFGYIPHLVNIPVRTISAWVTPTEAATLLEPELIAGLFGDSAAFSMQFYDDNEALIMVQKYSGVGGGQGVWNTDTSTVPYDTLTHVLIIKDLSSDNPPLMYINGVSETVNVFTAPPAGRTAYDETGLPFTIGNAKTATVDYTYTFGGRIEDVRVYKRALTQAEITELYNGGVPDYDIVTDDMIFQAITINSDLGDAASLDGQEIPEGHNYIDNVMRVVGVPNGSPLIRE